VGSLAQQVDFTVCSTAYRRRCHVLSADGRITHGRVVDYDPKLEDSERYRALVEASRALICVHDLDGNLLSVNPAAARCLGYTQSDLIGTNLRDLLSPSVRYLFANYLNRIRNMEADEGLMRVVTRNGEERIWAYCNVRAQEAGRPAYILGHAQDITELKRAELVAREAKALRSVAELARAAAHEINNPLAIIVGQLEMLKRSMVDNEDAVARIDIASEAARRITAIVSRMASITRLERADVSALPPMLDLRGSSREGEGRT
jgi:PAS domain S-box-containing protein